MNRSFIKKRLKTLTLYRDKIDDDVKLAHHLLGETIKRELEIEQKKSDAKVKLLSSKSAVFGEVMSSSVLMNKYCYGLSLEEIISDLNVTMQSIEVEKVRRKKEHQQLQGKLLSVSALIDKCKQQLAELASKEESRETEEWVMSSLTKTNAAKRLSRSR